MGLDYGKSKCYGLCYGSNISSIIFKKHFLFVISQRKKAG